MDLSNPPTHFWHCSVQVTGLDDVSVANDLAFEDLNASVIQPWLTGRAFVISGSIVRTSEQVSSITIAHTEQPLSYFVSLHEQRMRAANIHDWATNRALIPLSQGTDLTYALLFSGKQTLAPEPSAALVEELCRRLPQAARILGQRSRKGKTSYDICDEYDVQDLLHALIRGYLKYTVQEDTLPKIAGAKSGRVDISIEDIGVLIELKYARGPEDQKRIFEEYSQDLVLYAKWGPLQTLIYLIYNSADLHDPEAFETLSGKQEINGKRFEVKIVLA
jgi:hypothetical protein